MRVKLDWRKGAQENASNYYQLAKELAKKEEGAKKAMKETETALKAAEEERGRVEKVEAEKKPAMKRKKELYEKYKWFFTSGGKLVVAGRDAEQNDLLVAKLMDENDLFFMPTYRGRLQPSSREAKMQMSRKRRKPRSSRQAIPLPGRWEARPWMSMLLKKASFPTSQGGFVGAGGFALSGKREWFRSTKLGLAIGMQDGLLVCLPMEHPNSAKLEFSLEVGKMEKGEAAKIIAKKTGANADEVLLALPSGMFSVNGRDFDVAKNRA